MDSEGDMFDTGNHASTRIRGKQAIRELIYADDLDGVVRHARAAGAKRTFRYLLSLLHSRRG